jgi:hypothetical protein
MRATQVKIRTRHWRSKDPKDKAATGRFRWCNRCNARRPATIAVCLECGCPEFRLKR